MWKDDRDSWHLRVTAGTELNRSYVGSIVSNSPATSVQGANLESNDRIDTSDPSRIDFNLQVNEGFEDGIDFRFPTGASLSLNLEGDTQEAASLVQIGSEKWPVSGLPLDLSGW